LLGQIFSLQRFHVGASALSWLATQYANLSEFQRDYEQWVSDPIEALARSAPQ